MIGGIHPMLMTPVGGGGLKPQDVFATSLYTGTGSAQTINCGFQPDLVWYKDRSVAQSHFLVDALRGGGQSLSSNLTDAQSALGVATSFLPTGFTTSSNNNGASKVAWSIKRAAKFFDVVTYTGNGVAERQIAHALGVAPGMVIIKQTDAGGNPWSVYHRSLGFSGSVGLRLNETGSGFSVPIGAADATTITLQSGGSFWNGSGNTYVAYLFAHDTDASGIVQCGSANGSNSDPGVAINFALPWKPQFLLMKNAGNGGANWFMIDATRGATFASSKVLRPNTSGAEDSVTWSVNFTSAGVSGYANGEASAGNPFIYLAIREPIL